MKKRLSTFLLSIIVCFGFYSSDVAAGQGAFLTGSLKKIGQPIGSCVRGCARGGAELLARGGAKFFSLVFPALESAAKSSSGEKNRKVWMKTNFPKCLITDTGRESIVKLDSTDGDIPKLENAFEFPEDTPAIEDDQFAEIL